MKQLLIMAALAAACIAAPPAQAQTVAADLLPVQEVATIVASLGMRPIDRPIWRNGRYVVHVIDRYGRELRVVLDAQDGEVLAVRPRGLRYGGEARPAPPPATVPAPPADDDDDEEFFDDERRQGSLMPPTDPPRVVPAPRETPTGAVLRRSTAAGRTDKDAAPLPRARPALANAQTAGPQAGPKAGAKKDVRMIDMSKPKPAAKAEDKPGEAIRF